MGIPGRLRTPHRTVQRGPAAQVFILGRSLAPLDGAADRRDLGGIDVAAVERRIERPPEIGLSPCRIAVIRVGSPVVHEAVLTVEEERAVGTVSTRDEALDLVRAELSKSAT